MNKEINKRTYLLTAKVPYNKEIEKWFNIKNKNFSVKT